MTTLRPGLLGGLRIAAHQCGEKVVEQLGALGATVVPAGEPGTPDALVCQVGSLEALEAAWPVIQTVAAEALIPAGPLPDGATRKVVLIGPRPGETGLRSAEPARAALENLARTL
jgi:hypothetical protein